MNILNDNYRFQEFLWTPVHEDNISYLKEEKKEISKLIIVITLVKHVFERDSFGQH